MAAPPAPRARRAVRRLLRRRGGARRRPVRLTVEALLAVLGRAPRRAAEAPDGPRVRAEEEHVDQEHGQAGGDPQPARDVLLALALHED
ncbi:hypothetical protein AN648_15200, partial [Listeria monocytogenes]